METKLTRFPRTGTLSRIFSKPFMIYSSRESGCILMPRELRETQFKATGYLPDSGTFKMEQNSGCGAGIAHCSCCNVVRKQKDMKNSKLKVAHRAKSKHL